MDRDLTNYEFMQLQLQERHRRWIRRFLLACAAALAVYLVPAIIATPLKLIVILAFLAYEQTVATTWKQVAGSLIVFSIYVTIYCWWRDRPRRPSSPEVLPERD